MKYGPFIFLGLLASLALSWLGMIAAPQFQIGAQQPTNVPPTNVIYPTPLSGLAAVGREVYRANGCAYCHTQVVRQDGTRLEVFLASAGTNQADVVQVLEQIRADLNPGQVQALAASAPKTVLATASKAEADRAQEALQKAGGEAAVRVIPFGADIERGWGTRLTVAHDYLYETPLMLGSTRLGPDLTNVGLRRPDPTWHMVHLYDPRLEVPQSLMPRYPYLFEKRKRTGQPAPGSLPISGDYDVFPTADARALAAYLTSLRAEISLFEAPAPMAASAGAGDTNQPAGSGGATNLPSAATTNPPAPAQTPPQ